MKSNHQEDRDDRVFDPSAQEVQEARRTAYALHQVSGRERAEVEAELAASETARREVQTIRALANHVRDAARATDVPPSAALRAALKAQLTQTPPPLIEMPARDLRASRQPRIWKGYDWRTWAAVAAAACLFVVGTVSFYTRFHVAPDRPADVAVRAAASPQDAGQMPHAGRSASGEDLAAAGSPGSGVAGTPGTVELGKGRAATPDEPKSSSVAVAPVAAPAGVPDVRGPAPGRLAAEGAMPGPSAPSSPEAAGQGRSSPPAPPESAPAMVAAKAPSSSGAPDKALAGLRSRWSAARRLPATDPGFLWPVGPVGPVFMYQKPPEIVVPPPKEPPNQAKGAVLPGGSETFGQSEASPAPDVATGIGKHASAGTNDIFLPPGMRLGSTDRNDNAKAGKKGKGPSPAALDDVTPEEPAPSDLAENGFLPAERFPYSTFSLESDSSVYPGIARFLRAGRLPPVDRVQIEDLVNFFPFDDPQPKGDLPFSVSIETAECPWARGHRLVRVAIVARRAPASEPEADGAGQGRAAQGNTEAPLPIANDVRVQLKFAPARVASYRLLGYDGPPAAAKTTQGVAPAGISVEPGHTVTALYEVIPAQPQPPERSASENRVPKSHRPPARDLTAVPRSEEFLTVRLRYQRPGAEQYWLLECVGTDSGQSFAAASRDFQFAAAVAAFGMELRRSQFRGDISLESVAQIADSARGEDPGRLRAGLVELVRIARQLGAGR